MTVADATLTFPLGAGVVTCDPLDGSVLGVQHPAHPDLNFLLAEDVGDWHTAAFRWGKGFVITDAGSARWDHPAALHHEPDGLDLRYELLPGLTLHVQRRFGALWRETYRFEWSGTAPLELRSLAVSTPWRDLYRSARECLTAACSAHLWTGGSHAWVWAVPMNAAPPGLALTLRRGELWAYSVESRNAWTGGVRGHLYLHVTDAARAPHAMGGQPVPILAPGEAYTLAWDLDWAEDADEAEARAAPPVRAPRLAAPLGEALSIQAGAAVTLSAPGLDVQRVEGGFQVMGRTSGVRHLEARWPGGHTRLGVLFHRPLREIVEGRARFVLTRQRAVDRDPTRRGAFLPYDTRSGLRLNKANWRDWSDGRERLAMPLLLQETLRRGWGEAAELRAALRDFDTFARAHLLDDGGTVFDDSEGRDDSRLYNFPWLADFYLGQFELFGHGDDLTRAHSILTRYYALGGGTFLAIGASEAVERAAHHLRRAGRAGEASDLEAALLGQAAHFVALGTDLPAHEMSYEQSIVAPLVSLLSAAQRLRPSAQQVAALATALRWLLSFAGQQPHVRLRHVPIRHWDGYWFGAWRQWGDLFPHHWSVLTAAALRGLPGALVTVRTEEIASAILSANLAHFHDDGSATCAFIYPSCVDGQPAHHEDPLANDQDWALVYALRHGAEQRGTP